LDKGLIAARVQRVTAPRNLRRDAIVAVGSMGADVYVLKLLADDPRKDGAAAPLGWVFLASIPAWHPTLISQTRTITAIAPVIGDTIMCGAKDVGTNLGASARATAIFAVDITNGQVTRLPFAFVGTPNIGSIADVNNGLAFATTDENVLIFNGAIWSLTSAQPAMNVQVVSVEVDRTTPEPVVFVATERRVFVSADQGRTWHPASDGLPAATHLSDLLLSDADDGARLYLSTYGRSVWVARRRERWVSP
jgi:hypothetical protein